MAALETLKTRVLRELKEKLDASFKGLNLCCECSTDTETSTAYVKAVTEKERRLRENLVESLAELLGEIKEKDAVEIIKFAVEDDLRGRLNEVERFRLTDHFTAWREFIGKKRACVDAYKALLVVACRELAEEHSVNVTY